MYCEKYRLMKPVAGQTYVRVIFKIVYSITQRDNRVVMLWIVLSFSWIVSLAYL